MALPQLVVVLVCCASLVAGCRPAKLDGGAPSDSAGDPVTLTDAGPADATSTDQGPSDGDSLAPGDGIGGGDEPPVGPINECALGLDACDANADCTDTAAGYACSCRPGFFGSGRNCAALTTAVPCELSAAACDVILTGSYVQRNYTGVDMSGKVICIEGTVGALDLTGLRGSPEAPAQIINCGGLAVIDNASNTAMWAKDFHFVRMTGTGDPALTRGISVTSGNNGLDFYNGSSDLELDHLELDGIAGVAIVVRSYPACAGGVVAYRRGDYLLENVLVHDNEVRDTGGEGLYLGTSHHQLPEGYGTLDCDGDTVNDPHPEADARNIRVYRNLLERTGKDGIQVGAAIGGAAIFDNIVRDWAAAASPGVDNKAYELNPGTRADFYRNVAETAYPARGPALSIQGAGGTVIWNNLFVGAVQSIYVLRSTGDDASPHLIYNNTIINRPQGGAEDYAIRAWCITDPRPVAFELENNLVTGWGGLAVQRKAGSVNCWTASNNLFVDSEATPAFIDAGGGDFHLTAGSTAAIDAGLDLSPIVVDDFDGRPRNPPYDLGAFEYEP